VSPNYCSLNWTASSGVTISNSTAVSPGFTISTLGTFTITLTVQNENGTVTAPMAITTTTCLDVSVRENAALLNSMKLVPNPSNNSSRLQFNTGSSTKASVTVTDLTGKMLVNLNDLTTQAGQNTLELSTAELASGVYFVSLSTSAGKETVKLIVQH
jgi:PKD repeat protein